MAGRGARRLPPRALLVPLALLVVVLTSLMHTSAAHACGTSMSTAASSPTHAAAEHAGHAEHTDQADDHRGGAGAPESAAAAGAEHGGGQLCSSAAPPQPPALGAAAVVATGPADADLLPSSVAAASSPAVRGPPEDLLTVLCVRRT